MISFAVTAYEESRRNNFAWIRECLAPAAAHPFVSEIIVVDDGSSDVNGLAAAIAGTPKLRLEHLEVNHGVFGAKLESVIRASRPWVMMADSDNVFGADYFDRLAALCPFNAGTLYSPSFGKPALDYREMVGRWTVENCAELVKHRLSGCGLNTGNQFVSRGAFVAQFMRYRGPRFDLMLPDYFGIGDRSDLKWRRVYDSADSFFINKEWMLGGGAMEIVPNLAYIHGSLTPEHQRLVRSSWEQAPAEKDRLPPIFTRELLDAAGRKAVASWA